MWEHVAVSSGGRVERWADAVAADAAAPNVALNRTTTTDPNVDPAGLIARTKSFYETRDLPWGIVDTWGSLNLTSQGFTTLVRMPCMVLDPGSRTPFGIPDGLKIERVTDDRGLVDFKRALFRGFTLVSWPEDLSALFRRRFYEDDLCRLWVGYVDGEPAACSVSVIREGIVGVYLVAVVPEARNRRIGEALSWAATLADESLPAVLQASAMGFPVYVRMGYRQIGECLFWTPPS